MLEELTDTPVEIGVASEWGYNIPLLEQKTTVCLCLVNQVKQQIAVRFLVKANEMGIPSLTVTNVPGSTLSREANIYDAFTCRA